MKLLVAPILLLFISMSSYADARTSESLQLKREDGSKIDYYFQPQSHNSRSDTLLLILQGSDCNSVLKIKSIFSDYINVMPQADLLLIEKYGIDRQLSYNPDTERKDCPTQYLKNDNPEQRITDIQIVLSTLRSEHTYKNIIALGGSEGAVIANLLAAKVDYVDATISFNSGGRWFIDDILHNISSTNTNQEEAQQSIAGFKGFSEHILNSQPFEISVSGHGYHWWQQMLSIDQLDTLKKVNTPLLVVQGGSDLSVSPKKVDEMILALTTAGNNTIEYMTYEKLDHQFNNKEGKSELEDVITYMNTWLLSKLKDSDESS